MAINSCTINAFTINSARCRRPNLFRPPVPTSIIGTNNRNLSLDFATRFPQLVKHIDYRREDEQLEPLTFEQPFFTVTAELLGSVGTQQLDAANRLDFVIVTDLQVGPPRFEQDITVNILDFKVN